MLISALCDYYDLLESKGDILPDGYSDVKIHYLVHLTRDGEISYISDFQEDPPAGVKGKSVTKKNPRILKMPTRMSKSTISSEFIDHRAKYIFGLEYTNDGFTDSDSKAQKSHAAFVRKQLEIIDGLHSDLVDAYRKFVENWVPGQQKDNPQILGLGKLYSTAGYVFCLEGNEALLLHNDEPIKNRWQEFLQQEKEKQGDEGKVECAVLGEKLPVARIHNKIMGVVGGQASGNVLVNFNSDAEESYGKTQSYNSNISITAMEKYTEALNKLLHDKETHNLLGDITIIQWAISSDTKYEKIIQDITFGDFNEKLDKDETLNYLTDVISEARDGEVKFSRLDTKDIDTNVVFYIAGFKANASRISVKFVYRKKFGELLQNIAQHQADMQMSADAKPIPLWRIKKELTLPGSKSTNVDPAFYTKIFESIIQGHFYPNQLLYTVLKRIKNDIDDDKNKFIKINSTRVGIIKAYLNRYFKVTKQKEVMTMALDEKNYTPAYLCGRLFAVLEKTQKSALGNGLNRTIKDSYFSSACSRPAAIFPKIMRLSQYHLSKSEYKDYWNGQIGGIMSHMNEGFPMTLSLIEQGAFVLGYYHQFYAKSNNDNNKKGEETNE